MHGSSSQRSSRSSSTMPAPDLMGHQWNHYQLKRISGDAPSLQNPRTTSWYLRASETMDDDFVFLATSGTLEKSYPKTAENANYRTRCQNAKTYQAKTQELIRGKSVQIERLSGLDFPVDGENVEAWGSQRLSDYTTSSQDHHFPKNCHISDCSMLLRECSLDRTTPDSTLPIRENSRSSISTIYSETTEPSFSLPLTALEEINAHPEEHEEARNGFAIILLEEDATIRVISQKEVASCKHKRALRVMRKSIAYLCPNAPQENFKTWRNKAKRHLEKLRKHVTSSEQKVDFSSRVKHLLPCQARRRLKNDRTSVSAVDHFIKTFYWKTYPLFIKIKIYFIRILKKSRLATP